MHTTLRKSTRGGQRGKVRWMNPKIYELVISKSSYTQQILKGSFFAQELTGSEGLCGDPPTELRSFLFAS
jgi:hypothetical protein